MAKIKKPDANPVLALILTIFVLQIGHILNGQMQKWIRIIILWLIGSILCCLPGMIVAIFSWIDTYQTATRLKNGEEIDENEYSFEPLYKIAKIIDKTAVFKGSSAQ